MEYYIVAARLRAVSFRRLNVTRAMDGLWVDDRPPSAVEFAIKSIKPSRADFQNSRISAHVYGSTPLEALLKPESYEPPRRPWQLVVFSAIVCAQPPRVLFSGVYNIGEQQRPLIESIMGYLTQEESDRLIELLQHRQVAWWAYGHGVANEEAIRWRRLRDALYVFPAGRRRALCLLLLSYGYLERFSDHDMSEMDCHFGAMPKQ